ncbi:peptide chain release factor 2 (bRF-2) [Deinococcus yavapaiensis KR-236]|uniref:Peptide chain release factor 2 n=2 Tax=Deinococcus TaxID=1298 RepID=A0A318SAL2_9DEIO|nr:peptide chain release factor 2 (bRF-2) [Deinococcus yavapaiensis KR-236]
MLEDPSLWNDPNKGRQVSQEANSVRRVVEGYERLKSDAQGLAEMMEMASDEEREMLLEEQESIQHRVDDLYKETLFTMKHADAPAIVKVKSGAGGTESQDWAGMLQRMYMRWAERHGFKVDLLDEQAGEQAGVVSAEFIVRGDRAFGMMVPEHGVHRLVRVSPFDSNNRRHTSFASVDVVPEVPEQEIDIVVPDSEVRVDVYRSQGAGGQGVNTTDSAVRVTHLPTGLIVAIQVTRSQIKNREMAFQILKQRLYDMEMRKREEEDAKARGEQKKIEWGSQIRSYVLDKQYIKDHRTGLMRHDPSNVLDGDIEDLQWAGLEWLAGKRVTETADVEE